MSAKRTCEICGAELPPDGFCVSCLLGLAVEGSASMAPEETVAPSEAMRSPQSRVAEIAGERIGPYKLLEMIGEGGMGRVWMAEQTEPLRRTVALKVIKTGLDSAQVLARFEAERQALALMDHPNIAKVLEAGTTPEGRPYFVLELVKGVHLTKFCEEQRLSIPERLRLFVAVCQAIQHAHQKGIIHRDIKPSNVLVALYDGQPVPKVIDFGVAKATEQRLTERTLFTHFGAIVGTPEYMSPEQAELNQLDIDTRSDVYSLGVLLYELLTGTTPLNRDATRRAAFDEILRRIREEDPPRPSTFLTQANVDLGAISAQRKLEPRELLRALRGDLDWIVMKALEKERTRRYDTANGLLRDVERFLANEPVTARPPSRKYQLQKLARRNRLAFAAGATTLVMLLAGLGVTSWLLVRERRARERADGAERAQAELRRKAELAAENSRRVARFLTDMLESVGPSVALGRDATMLRDILDKTSEQIGKELNNQPEVEANLRSTLCKVYGDLGEYERAEAMGIRALEIKKQLLGSQHTDVAEALHDLARAVSGRGKFPEAEAMDREALAIRQQVLGNSHAGTARSLNDLGSVLLKRAKYAEAETSFRAALGIYEKLDAATNRHAAEALGNLAAALHAQNKYAEAEPVYRQALAASKSLFGVHPQVAALLNELGVLLDDQRKLAEAEVILREAVTMRRKLLGQAHPHVADSIYVLCDALLKQGKYREADDLLAEHLTPGFSQKPESVPLLRVRARVLARRSQWQRAALDFWQIIAFAPSDHRNYLQLAPILVHLVDTEGSRRLGARMVAEFRDTKDIAIAERMTKASLLWPAAGMDVAALRQWSEKAIREGQGHVYLPYFQFARGLLGYREGELANAADWMQKVLTKPGESSLRNAHAFLVLAMAQFRLNRVEDARSNLTRGLEILDKKLPKAESGDLETSWHDWLISHIIVREARQLIENGSAPVK